MRKMERYFAVNQAGHNIRCKLYCNDPRGIRRIVVFCHGFCGHKDNAAAAKFAQKMLAKWKGSALVTFDFPVHGDDVKKKISLSDCVTYLDFLVQDLLQRYAPETLYVYATSFGAYVTLKYIQEKGNPFGKIALRCPAIDMYQSFTNVILDSGDKEKLEKGKDVPVGFDRKVMVSPQFLRELEGTDIRNRDYLDWAEDMRIFHGTADEIVPIESAASFADEQLIEFVPIEGADHRFHNPVHMDLAIKLILEFFQSV